MNCPPSNYRTTGWRIGALLGVWLLVLALPSPAQTTNATAMNTNRPAPERFLLIVETSAFMQDRAGNVQRIVGFLFSSGLTAQMERGDTIGVWTYDTELHTGGLPLQHWSPQTSREIATKLVQFIQRQRYANMSRLAPVMATLASVVAESDKITVILISDGSEPLAGTPFDRQIAEAFRLNVDEQRRQSMPFVTVLRAAHGKFVGLRVNTPPWPFELPPYPKEMAPVAPAVPAPPTNPPPTEVKNPPPTPTVTPVVETEPLPVAVEPTNAVPPASNLPVAVVAPPSVELPTPPPAAASNVTRARVTPTNAARISPASTTAPAVNVKRKLPLMPILIGSGVVLVGLVILCLAILSRSRKAPRVSLITRSMNKDGK